MSNNAMSMAQFESHSLKKLFFCVVGYMRVLVRLVDTFLEYSLLDIKILFIHLI